MDDAVMALEVERGLLNDQRLMVVKNEERSHYQSSEKKHKQKNNNDYKVYSGKNEKVEVLERVTVVMKVEFHCDGCRGRIFEAARSFRGAETVKIEVEKSKLTVTGRVDPVKLHEKLERRLKKKIDLLSPQPKKSDKTKKEDDHNKNKKKPKEPPLTTVVLKMSLHCDGCCRRIRHIVRKTEGVHGVEINREKELVTIHGAVEPKAMQMRLKMKMKRSTEIVPAKKEKEKEKMEQSNGGNQKHQQNTYCSNNSNYRGAEVAMDARMTMDHYRTVYGYAPAAGYVVERLPAPQIFSDENPHACFVM